MRLIVPFLTAVGFAVLLSSCQTEAKSNEAQVTIFKYDGSLQCEGRGVPIESMQTQLTDQGIPVTCAESSNDGMMRMMMCGADTGNIHVFRIRGADLSAAQALGFELTTTLSNYQGDACSPASQKK